MNQKDIVLLAFSGGLDTSFCVKYLKHEKQLSVYSAIVNTGGFTSGELDDIRKKAYALGVEAHVSLEQTEVFYEKIVKYLIFGNVLKNNSYPLSVSAERVHQAIALAEHAKSIGAKYLAHGSTGAGNDQVRFDLIFQLIAPDIEILTPIRTLQLTRDEEIAYLQKHGVRVDTQKAKYSINKGLWGTSVGGVETLRSDLPLPESAYPNPLRETTPRSLKIGFERGEIISVDDEKVSPVQGIRRIDAIAQRYAIGRDIHVGDTIIGIKGRVGFEAAAATVIIKAHHALEKHCLSKWQLHWKEQLAGWYGMFLHEAQYFDPVMRNIEHFLRDTQEYVSGEVMLTLAPYRFAIDGIRSPHDLMRSEFGQYGETNNQWNGEDVKGFTKILANPVQIFNHVNRVI